MFSFEVADTPENRQVAVVFLRCLRDAEGQALFTLQQVAASMESDHRQAADCHVRTFRAGGEEFKALVLRKQKVEVVEVEVVWAEVVRDPLVETAELSRRVNARLGRVDLSAANIEAALEQLSCRELRRMLRGRLEQGEVHYTEEGVLKDLLQRCAVGGDVPAGIEVPQLEADAEGLGIGGWVRETVAKLPMLLPTIGSRILPRTTNAIERCFRTFNRFYKGRCGFHAIRSATWELLLFVLVSLFTQRAKDGMAPIEASVPEARQMPLYRLIHDPLAVLLGVEHVTLPQPIAHEAFHDALAA